MSADHVAIVGGGFSGAMLAAQLVRAGMPRVTLIDRRAGAGLGLAYGAADPIHLLNVPGAKMSAWPDVPDHFAKWLEARGIGNAATTFAPRPVFGEYVCEQLAEALASGRLEIIAADVVDVENGLITLGDGRTIAADAVVLAIGNLPPPPPPGIDPAALPPATWWGDPWQPGVADGLGPDDAVAVIGTGLSMVDMVLLLEQSGFAGPILALSRRGLIPHAHAPGAPPEQPLDRARDTTASALVRAVRTRGDAIGWRQAIDELRPFTQAMWKAATPEERRRFTRHLRPWWDIHRHRIAPDIRARIDAMIARGQLRVAAGKIVAAQADGDAVRLSYRPRGSDEVETVRVARLINCTGPEGDLPRSNEPVLRSLLARGAIRPGPSGLGVDVSDDMRVMTRDGEASAALYAVGPLTRGVLWEIVAVPDIRVQVQALARCLAGIAA